MFRLLFHLILAALIFSACQQINPSANHSAFPAPPDNNTLTSEEKKIKLSPEDYYDKVLGLLVGSAIGDAMGAPVEMWDRHRIRERYGFIDGLIPNARVASAEGTWHSNMIAGTSTDDTRWKWLMGRFFMSLKNKSSDNTPTSSILSADPFAQFIINEYRQIANRIVEEDGLQASELEANMRQLQWLQEWAKVADAWLSKDVQQYASVSNKFYGGEMACGGMLYAPMIALLHPGQPLTAYRSAWNLSMFDIGYAKDITAMTAALTAGAFDNSLTTDSLMALHYAVDPEGFADSRLIGRIVNGIYENALSDHNSAFKRLSPNLQADVKNDTFSAEQLQSVPAYFKADPEKYFLMKNMFNRMDGRLQDISFHANEIYMITLSSLVFAQGNFMDAMVFVTNYGRDNDTVGAVVGAILGAQLGFSNLPKGLSEKVLAANMQELNLDLKWLAEQLARSSEQ